MRFIRKEVIKMAHEHLITQEGYNDLIEKIKELVQKAILMSIIH